MSKRTTQKVKLVRRLATGKNLTVSEAETRFGIQSLSARIHELREDGFRIYTSRVRVRSGKNAGEVVTAYTLNVKATPPQLFSKVVGV